MAVFSVAERDRLAKSIFTHICDRENYDKKDTDKSRWVTIKGAHVKIAGDGSIEAGPAKLKQHLEDKAGGFALSGGKEKIGRGLGAGDKFAETSKGKQVNLFHGLHDKPGQGQLFGGLDMAGASAADLKPVAKKAEPEPEPPAAKSGEQQFESLPDAVKHHVKFHAGRLQDIHNTIAGVNSKLGKRYAWEAAKKEADKVTESRAKLDEFKGLAAKNNIDADAVIGHVGGAMSHSASRKPPRRPRLPSYRPKSKPTARSYSKRPRHTTPAKQRRAPQSPI
jgi:hypothetical protein